MKRTCFFLSLLAFSMASLGQSYCVPPQNTNPDAYAKAQYHEEIAVTAGGVKTILQTQTSQATYTNYNLFSNVIEVPQGTQISISWKDSKTGTSSCSYQQLFLYFDTDANKDFNGIGERIAVLGNPNSSSNSACANGSYSITIPETMPVGTITRIRLYFQGSYEANQGPCNETKRKCSDIQIKVTEKPTDWNTVSVATNDATLGTASIQDVPGNSISVPKTQPITITATPKANNRFIKWIDNEGNTVSKEPTYTFTPSTNVTYTAVFALPGYPENEGTMADGTNGYLVRIETSGAKTNINYSSASKPSTLINSIEQTLTVERGTEITMTLSGDASKYLKNCHKYLFIDWNGNREFNARNELVAAKESKSSDDGASNWTITFKVPEYYAQAQGRVKLIFTRPKSATFEACKKADIHVEKGIVYEFPIIVEQAIAENPMIGLIRRIDPTAVGKFTFEKIASDKDVFELDQNGDKIVIRGNNYSTMGAGLNWYLKYYCGIHLSWNGMTATLPASLPKVMTKERRESKTDIRYYLNYCTFSYSMAFWDWERWEKEIDWMILHGINLPLAITGGEMVWYKLLKEYGYTIQEIGEFVAGPGFLAWWHMNNLEAWGGPNPDYWYTQQVDLQRKIITRYRDYNIEPCFAGYAGMVPSNAQSKLGLSVTNPGHWQNFKRPFFLKPTDARFNEFADKYYQITEELFGTAKYFGIDPFHEGGGVDGVDLNAAGQAIMSAVKRTNPNGVWVVQAWQSNPREAVIGNIPAGDILVLDLFSESYPMWGDQPSPWYRSQGYKQHEWVYNMLLNFGGRVGMFGKMNRVINSYYKALEHANGQTLRGVGTSMEAIENNPVMYELLYELPWQPVKQTKEEYAAQYAKIRYGSQNNHLADAWKILANTSYNCSDGSTQEGTTGSVFCGRPSLANDMMISCCDGRKLYYNPADQVQALTKMIDVADNFRGNNNFEYDLVDVMRQSIADKAHTLRKEIVTAFNAKNRTLYLEKRKLFLDLLLAQDRLCGTRPEFMVGTWLEQAKKIAPDAIGKTLNEWNARTLITVWGPRTSADAGLKDYSYREWNGLLKDFYYVRWKKFFDELDKVAGSSTSVPSINWFSIEEPWTRETKAYPTTPTESPVDVAKELYETFFNTPELPSDGYCEPTGTQCPDAEQGYVTKAETTGASKNISITRSVRPATAYNLEDNQTIIAKKGSTFTFNITADTKPGFNGQDDYRYMKWTNRYIWIDWNGDKTFSSSELVGSFISTESTPTNNSAHVSQAITVPNNAFVGTVRLRFKFANRGETVTEPCTDAYLGGTYDYLLQIEDNATSVEQTKTSQLNFHPNLATDCITLTQDVKQIVIYNTHLFVV